MNKVSRTLPETQQFEIKMKELLDFTTVEAQFFVEGIEFLLDLLRTGTVLSCTEIQQDVDLQKE